MHKLVTAAGIILALTSPAFSKVQRHHTAANSKSTGQQNEQWIYYEAKDSFTDEPVFIAILNNSKDDGIIAPITFSCSHTNKSDTLKIYINQLQNLSILEQFETLPGYLAKVRFDDRDPNYLYLEKFGRSGLIVKNFFEKSQEVEVPTRDDSLKHLLWKIKIMGIKPEPDKENRDALFLTNLLNSEKLRMQFQDDDGSNIVVSYNLKGITDTFKFFTMECPGTFDSN